MEEPAVDFERPRAMRCGSCRHEWFADAEWLNHFDRGLEACPRCGTDCQGEDRPDFCAASGEPTHDDAVVRRRLWYHSSTHATWPDRDHDPAARLTAITKERMASIGDGRSLRRWTERQKSKALHLGTYEAAIENMFRRIADQGDSERQFYLFRVQIKPDCVIEAGIHDEPTDFMGDTQLADVCRSGTSVLRYVNRHEDPSSISLAVDISAITSVQGIEVPLPTAPSDPWVGYATRTLQEAARQLPDQPRSRLQKLKAKVKVTTALEIQAQRLEREIASKLPTRLGERLSAGFDASSFEADPSAFPRMLMGLALLADTPQTVLRALDSRPWRPV